MEEFSTQYFASCSIHISTRKEKKVKQDKVAQDCRYRIIPPITVRLKKKSFVYSFSASSLARLHHKRQVAPSLCRMIPPLLPKVLLQHRFLRYNTQVCEPAKEQTPRKRGPDPSWHAQESALPDRACRKGRPGRHAADERDARVSQPHSHG